MFVNASIDEYIRINEIKNYIYCPRIPFYTLCLSLDRETALSKIGIENEDITKKRMKRRKHAAHAVHNGTRHLDVPVTHHDLRLVGRVDELIMTDDGVYVIDYKDTDRDYGYWRVQMTAYKLCLTAAGHKVLDCYIYSIPDQTYHSLKLAKRDESRLKTILASLQRMIETEIIPAPTRHHRKCVTCQYERFCNDVL